MQGHYLNNLGSTPVPNTAYQVSRPSVHWLKSRRFLKALTIYGHGGHVGHVTWTVEKKIVPSAPGRCA